MAETVLDRFALAGGVEHRPRPALGPVEFVAHLGKIVAIHRVGELVDLLESMLQQRAVVLLQVPGTTGLRVAQTAHQFAQLRQSVSFHHTIPDVQPLLRWVEKIPFSRVIFSITRPRASSELTSTVSSIVAILRFKKP